MTLINYMYISHIDNGINGQETCATNMVGWCREDGRWLSQR